MQRHITRANIYREPVVEGSPLTHWGRVTHICVGNLTIIGSDNGLSPGRRQAITFTNVWKLLIGPLGINFSEILIKIHTFSFKKIHLKMSSGKWRPSCLGLNVLRQILSLTWNSLGDIRSLHFMSSYPWVQQRNYEYVCISVMNPRQGYWKYIWVNRNCLSSRGTPITPI